MPEAGRTSPAGESGRASPQAAEWFRRAFDEFYIHLYAHRDDREAVELVETLRRRFGLEGAVLDVACGPGRFLRALRAQGIRAIGIDLSLPLLRAARAAAAPVRPDLVRADMRRLPIRSGACAWALLLFTSFGYFAQAEEDEAVVAELRRILRGGGKVALDFLNSVRTVRDLVPESSRSVSGRLVREIRWVEGPFLNKRIDVAGAGPLPPMVYHERVRLYTPPQLRTLLEENGLEVEAMLGDYSGAPFEAKASARCLLIARRGER